MYFLFDIGGTNIRIGISRDGSTIEGKEMIPRPEDFVQGMKDINQVCQKYIENEPVKGVAVGVAGVIKKEKGILLHAPNMKGWENRPLGDTLKKLFKSPVIIENDTDMAGLGEAVHGAGSQGTIVAYLAIGTGVGGTRIVNKSFDKQSKGFEPGHQIIFPDGNECLCGGKGHLEAYVSGGAVQRMYGKKPYDITDKAFWDNLAKILAIGVHNSIVHWSPDIVVIGGSMMNTVGIPVEAIRTHLASLMRIFPDIPLIEKATLGQASGLYGGLVVANQSFA